MKQHILVVDSDSLSAEWSMRTVSAANRVRVSIAKDGASALEAVSRDAVAVVIANARLRDMSAYELCASLKAFNPDIQLVVVGNKESLEHPVEKLSEDDFDFLAAPCSPARLLWAAQRACRLFSLIQENRRLKDEVGMLKESVDLNGSDARECLSLRETERKLIVSTLKECHGNKHLTAKLLRIPRSTLYSKIQKHRICLDDEDVQANHEFGGNKSALSAAGDTWAQ